MGHSPQWDVTISWSRQFPWAHSLLESQAHGDGWLASLAGGASDPGAISSWIEALGLPEERDWIRRLASATSEALGEMNRVESWCRLSRLSAQFQWPTTLAIIEDEGQFQNWVHGARMRLEEKPSWRSAACVPPAILNSWLNAQTSLTAETILVRSALPGTWATGPKSPGDQLTAGGPETGGNLSEEELQAKGRSELSKWQAGDFGAGERARSLAELLLFRRLQNNEASRGLFHLNQKVGLRWPSGRPLELDLSARDQLLAVEVDGPHHFGDLDAWRRDRKKDLILQIGGWLVVRALASDVMNSLDSVEETVLEALRSRHVKR